MILRALNDYYHRKALDPESGMAPEGFEWKEISFVVVIDLNGHFIALEDTREGQGRDQKIKRFLLPKANQRTGSQSFATTNFLWDHVGYLFEHPKSESEKDITLAKRQHKAWVQSLNEVGAQLSNLPEILAMQSFYAEGGSEKVKNHSLWQECVKKDGTNLVFRIDGATDPIPCTVSVREHLNARLSSIIEFPDEKSDDGESIAMRCLITGEFGEIARIHTKTPINKDCKSLVGIQQNMGYDSYGKTQAYNSPISRKAEAAYTSALKGLLERGSKNKVNIGDSTTVFWADKKVKLEDDFFSFWNYDKDDPDRNILAVKSLLSSPYSGTGVSEDTTQFYVLGLAPGGGSRISIRFWKHGTVADFSAKIRQHFQDLNIVLPKNDKGNYALFFLLSGIAIEGELDKIQPNIPGNVMQSILTGGPYPATLLQQTVRRIRAEQKRKNTKDENVSRVRASILKAFLNRKRRFQSTPTEEEITVALDPNNTNAGYRLGRLFAALEKIQEDAQPGISATIRDRFYGAACSSPISVFPQLLKLKNHHLAKLENPAFRTVHEKRLGEIFSGLNPDMPAHLPMEDQARFAVGYYHQRQAFFAKSDKSE